MIPYGRQHITQADIDAVTRVLHADYLTQGPEIPLFEDAFKAYCGAKYAVAVNSATSGLHIACLALGLGPGDLLWSVPNTFAASTNCALYCGAEVDFIDIDPNSWNISIPALEQKLVQAKKAGRLPKIVIPVHFSGMPCDLAAIHALAQEYGFHVIEDAAHASGASYEGTKIGDGRFSDMAVFSFHPVKIMTTAEGGMVTTNSQALYQKLARLRTHGITRDTAQMTNAPHGPWYYQQLDLGYNYRLTDMQAALGRSQLQRIDTYVQTRRDLAQRYHAALGKISNIQLPVPDTRAQSSHHLYVVRVPASAHAYIFDRMRQSGIGVNLHYIPVYWHPYYQQLGFQKGLCPEGERYYAEAISLPLYPGLTDDQHSYVCSTLENALAERA